MPKENIGSTPTVQPLDAKTFSAIIEKIPNARLIVDAIHSIGAVAKFEDIAAKTSIDDKKLENAIYELRSYDLLSIQDLSGKCHDGLYCFLNERGRQFEAMIEKENGNDAMLEKDKT